MLPEQSKLTWSTIVSTIIRLSHRVRNRQLWWDDYVAIIPLILDCVYFSILWVSLSNGDYLRYSQVRSETVNVFSSFLLGSILNLAILWFSRISLALSLARIFPSGHLARRIFCFLSSVYISCYFVVNGLVIGLCQSDSDDLPWFDIDPNNCKTGSIIHIPLPGLVAILFNLLADLILFMAPSLVLRKIKLPNNERRLILVTFSASILTLLSTVVFAIFWYSQLNLGPDALLLRIATAQIETMFSLIACNSIMVTTFFYRIFRRTCAASHPMKPKKSKCNCPPMPPSDSHPPPPEPPPTPPADLEARESEQCLAYEITDNIVEHFTHLTLTEISGGSCGSVGGLGLRRAESAPVLGQQFSLRKANYFLSLP